MALALILMEGFHVQAMQVFAEFYIARVAERLVSSMAFVVMANNMLLVVQVHNVQVWEEHCVATPKNINYKLPVRNSMSRQLFNNKYEKNYSDN